MSGPKLLSEEMYKAENAYRGSHSFIFLRNTAGPVRRQACAIIIDEKGKQFDPELVDVFLIVVNEFHNVRNRFSTDDLTV